jgi:molybdate transport system ATP-binding protein
MTLSVAVRHRQGDFALEADFESGGRLTALFGPSGSGKTTLVNIIGGLVRPLAGRVEVDGRVLVDTERGLFAPPHRRRIGYVFQDARLFPHFSVRQNLKYGRFFAPRGEGYADFDAVVGLLGIGPLLDRRPASLSGGEKQRVALGRALVASPRLILMDEPLASLDEARKAEIMPYLERLRDELLIPIVYVSHSLAEVSRLATDIVRLSAGRVVARGPAREVLTAIGRSPGDPMGDPDGGPFAIVDLEVVGQESHGIAVLKATASEWRLALEGLGAGSRIRAKIDASDVIVATEAPRGISALNTVPVVIERVLEDRGGRMLAELATGSDRLLASLTRRSVNALGLAPGKAVYAVVKSVAVDSIPMRQP